VCTLRDAMANIAIDGTIDFASSILAATITLAKGQLFAVHSMPRWHRGGIDAAASCNDAAPLQVAIDEHGTPRPQGAACDLGAIEADYLRRPVRVIQDRPRAAGSAIIA
jgi:hypothetical protein